MTVVLAIGGTLAFCLGAYEVLTSPNPAGYVFLFGGSVSVAGAQVLHQLRTGSW